MALFEEVALFEYFYCVVVVGFVGFSEFGLFYEVVEDVWVVSVFLEVCGGFVDYEPEFLLLCAGHVVDVEDVLPFVFLYFVWVWAVPVVLR